jgi:hypothetical protein
MIMKSPIALLTPIPSLTSGDIGKGHQKTAAQQTQINISDSDFQIHSEYIMK